MPALRKPTSVLEANGAYEANPARRREGEPQAGGIGPAPDHLSEDERVAWDEVVQDCAAGVFQSSDRRLLERLCGLIAKSRSDPSHFGIRQEQLLLKMLGLCGMTPADRSRVFVLKQPSNDKPKTGLASFRR